MTQTLINATVPRPREIYIVTPLTASNFYFIVQTITFLFRDPHNSEYPKECKPPLILVSVSHQNKSKLKKQKKEKRGKFQEQFFPHFDPKKRAPFRELL